MALRVCLEFELRSKSRLLVTLENGEQVGLVTERGRLLRGGDVVSLADGRAVAIVAADEQVMEARSDDPRQLIRVAYHLGNRHVAVELRDEGVRFLADHVLGEMVTGLGLHVTSLVAPFEPEGGAYGHAHAHMVEPAPGRPKIHSFTTS